MICESDPKSQPPFRGKLISYACFGLHSPGGPDPEKNGCFSLAIASSILTKIIQLCKSVSIAFQLDRQTDNTY